MGLGLTLITSSSFDNQTKNLFTDRCFPISFSGGQFIRNMFTKAFDSDPIKEKSAIKD